MAFLKKLKLAGNRQQTVLLVLLVIASFIIGSLYTKVRYLEGGAPAAGGGQAAQGASKYKSFDDAMRAMAKIAKADEKKLVTCMNSGEKKAVVDADTAEGNSLGVNGTPAFFINGRLLGGAFPFESFKEIIDKELAGTGSNNVANYSQTLQDAAQQGSFDPVQKVVAVGSASTKGPGDAKVTIVEYSDFQCPYCARAFPTVQQILSEYGNKVQFVYKHYPLISIHPRAQITAEASECAKDQGKFWEFHDALFQNQTDWSSL
jgi:protein-disulfide isomerase